MSPELPDVEKWAKEAVAGSWRWVMEDPSHDKGNRDQVDDDERDSDDEPTQEDEAW
jgi:hypothetical protein